MRLPKAKFINNQDYLSASSLKDYKNYYGDSLKGFDENIFKAQLLANNVFGQEYINHVNRLKRNYIKQKYNIGFEFAPINNPNSNPNQNPNPNNPMQHLVKVPKTLAKTGKKTNKQQISAHYCWRASLSKSWLSALLC